MAESSINKIVVLLFLLYFELVKANSSESGIVTFTFPEYKYKETSKNELIFSEYESACDQSQACQKFSGVQRLLCVRQCISPSCYLDLYSSDLLEEGEVDVRLNSFKGCFIQRYTRPRS